jgi:adenosylhomocysteine nucleosidase
VIAITFALPAESAGLVRLLREKERRLCSDTQIIRGKIDNRTIEILHTGVGEKICRRRMAEFLQDRQFDLLISAGFAGALNDRLEVGDVLVAANFSTANTQQIQSLLSNHRVQPGELVTLSRVIDSREERYQIAKGTGAVAVDMETEFIARACAEQALPMLSLRAISDTPAQPLPAPPGILFDIDEQKTKLAQLSVYLLRHPNRMPRMILFVRQVRKARSALTDSLETLLRSDQL